MYQVMCRVSGGVTGTREAVLKDKNGREIIFDTKRKAENKAKRLNAMQRPYSTASFHYWVVEY